MKSLGSQNKANIRLYVVFLVAYIVLGVLILLMPLSGVSTDTDTKLGSLPPSFPSGFLLHSTNPNAPEEEPPGFPVTDSTSSGDMYSCNNAWACSEWSACINGQQTRVCNFVQVSSYTQSAPCPSSLTPPASSQSCSDFTQPAETCFDGIQNQDEESTDCGGVCYPCQQQLDIQSPRDFPPEDTQQSEDDIKKEQKGSSSAKKILIASGIFLGILVIAGSTFFTFKNLVARKLRPQDVTRVNYYIRNMRSRGRNDREIKGALLRAGWRERDIDTVMGKK